MKFKIVEAKKTDAEKISSNLDEYNERAVPIIQKESYKSFAYVIKDTAGKIIAGVEAYSSMYFVGYVETLWVDQEWRKQGLGTKLMDKVETEMHAYGCMQCHLETFDYQAPDFYKQRGYEVFGTLEHQKAGVKELFMVKKLLE